MMDIRFRETAAAYQALLIDWISQLRRQGLPVAGLPFALARITRWLRAFDAGTATLAEYAAATDEASRAAEEALLVLRADRHRRLRAFLRASAEGAAFLQAVEAAGLDLQTEVARLLDRARRGR